jgi:hypothetical protein
LLKNTEKAHGNASLGQIVKRRAIVKRIVGDEVLVLLEYNNDGESIICSIDRKCWNDWDPDIGQEIVVSWNPKLEDPPIYVTAAEKSRLSFMPHIELASEVLGFKPREKVAIIIGANREGPASIVRKYVGEKICSEEAKKAVNEITLKSVGWGEMMLLPRLISSLHSLGIYSQDIQYRMCETTAQIFDPNEFKDSHIIFLGSTRSNDILRAHYWGKLGFESKYSFGDYVLETINLKYATIENIPDDALENPSKINVLDYFLLARSDNPDSTPLGKYKCLLICGIGTFGTGFAGLAAVAQPSIRYLHNKFNGGDFQIIGRVDMKGMFNWASDPVHCIFDGKMEREDLMLAAAMSSAIISDPMTYSDAEIISQIKKRDPMWADKLSGSRG